MAMRASLAADSVPPLENGDRLSREEFERRYEASPRIKKAELIDGVVFVASPVSKDHSGPHFRLNGWLGYYASRHPDTEGHDHLTVRLASGDEVQPDLLLRRTDGMSRFDEDGFLVGSPDLVIEIAASSSSVDMHAKRRAYERAAVSEYLVWRTRENKVDWFVLRDGRFESLLPDAEGILESSVFPGLRLSEAVLLDGSFEDLIALLR